MKFITEVIPFLIQDHRLARGIYQVVSGFLELPQSGFAADSNESLGQHTC